MINPVYLPTRSSDVVSVTQRTPNIKEINPVANLREELASLFPDALADTVFEFLVFLAPLHNPFVLPTLKPLVRGKSDDGTCRFTGVSPVPLGVFSRGKGDKQKGNIFSSGGSSVRL